MVNKSDGKIINAQVVSFGCLIITQFHEANRQKEKYNLLLNLICFDMYDICEKLQSEQLFETNFITSISIDGSFFDFKNFSP